MDIKYFKTFIENLKKEDYESDAANLIETANKNIDPNDEKQIDQREIAIYKLGIYYAKSNKTIGLKNLVSIVKNHVLAIPRSRATTLVRDLIDIMLETECDREPAIELCVQCVEWARDEKRSFLLQILLVHLAELYFDTRNFKEAVPIVDGLIHDLKIFDNKKQLVEILLLESRLFYAMGNMIKSKTSLTCARTTANAVYVGPKVQAEIDLQTGTIHAKEGDFQTAYSYFYEAYELFNNIECLRATKALKYMCLCKIMLKLPEDLKFLIDNKIPTKYIDANLNALRDVGNAFSSGSISELDQVINTYSKELSFDLVIRDHIEQLKQNLFEKNVSILIEPYSSVKLSYLSEKLGLDINVLVLKTSNMILDNVFSGVLDEGQGVLEITQPEAEDSIMDNSLEILESYDEILDVLLTKDTAFKFL